LIDNTPISCKTIGEIFGLDGELLQRQYITHLSGFPNWYFKNEHLDHIIYPQNIGTHLSIDETSITQGELYTILTNKSAKGKKGTLVAMIKGTKTEDINAVIKQIPLNKRRKVKEGTCDLAHNMQNVITSCFTKANKVIDRFHVQKLALEAGLLNKDIEQKSYLKGFQKYSKLTNSQNNSKSSIKNLNPKELHSLN